MKAYYHQCTSIIGLTVIIALLNLVPSGPPQDINVTVISPEDVLVTWNDPAIEDQNGIVTGYVIDVTLVSTGLSFQRMSTTTNFLLENLLPFSTYTYRVAAMTNVGVGPYSTADSFLTDETGMHTDRVYDVICYLTLINSSL